MPEDIYPEMMGWKKWGNSSGEKRSCSAHAKRPKTLISRVSFIIGDGKGWEGSAGRLKRINKEYYSWGGGSHPVYWRLKNEIYP